jgi:hypothetical protein
MYRKTICLLALILIYFSTCLGQAPPVTILKGIILNSSTGEAISYATISLSANGINTMSNEEGQFIFKIPADDKGDSIYITHIGYKAIVLAISLSDTGIITIKLEQSFRQLPEVVVKPIDALDLVKQAIAKISDNCPMTPYLTNGFYRLTGTAENKIIDLSEAVFEIYSEDYARENKQFKLIKSRIDKDESAATFSENNSLYLGESPNAILHEDIVSEVDGKNLLNEDRLKMYDFTFHGIADYNGRAAYEIRFDQKDDVQESNRKGTLFLDSSNLAFLEFDYSLSPKGLKYWKLNAAEKEKSDLLGIQENITGNKVIVTYLKYGKKYYLNHVQRTTFWHITGGKNRLHFDPLVVKVDYLVTKIDTAGAKAFRKKEVLRNTQSIESQATHAIDDNFWESYNLIQADFNIDSAASIIRKKNQLLKNK